MSSFSTRGQELESSLKDLLQTVIDQILLYLENFIDNQEDLKLIEVELRDYEDLHELIKIIKTVFGRLTAKVDAKIGQRLFAVPSRKSNEYEKLELIIQRYEAQIREHIRNEHQLKIYAETLQQQLEESEMRHKQFIAQTTKKINGLIMGEHQQRTASNQIQTFNLVDKATIQIYQRNQNEKKLLQGSQAKRLAKKQLNEASQSSENQGFTQMQKNVGSLQNCGSTPLKYVRKQQSSHQALNELTRQRGTSMKIKRDTNNVEQQYHYIALLKGRQKVTVWLYQNTTPKRTVQNNLNDKTTLVLQVGQEGIVQVKIPTESSHISKIGLLSYFHYLKNTKLNDIIVLQQQFLLSVSLVLALIIQKLWMSN